MLSSVGQNNNVQRFSAVNALRTEASRLNKPAEEKQNNVIEETSLGVKSAPKGLLERVDVADIRKCAEFETSFEPPKPSEFLSEIPNHLLMKVVKVSTVVDDFSAE